VVYRARALDAAAEVLIDPNALSPDGTIALGGESFSEDGRHMAYALAASGSDWLEWHVRDVATSKDLPDLVKWSKFSGAAWLKDGSGFYYSRYDAPRPLPSRPSTRTSCAFPRDRTARTGYARYERPESLTASAEVTA
jgi:prolyl oligopeptidase